MNIKKLIAQAVITLNIAGIALPANAMPTIYDRPGQQVKNIKNSTITSVVGDHKSNTHFYVMPPSNGETKIVGTFWNANMGFCRNMQNLQGVTLSVETRLGDTQENMEEAMVEAEAIDNQIQSLTEERDEYYRDPLVNEAVDLQNEIEELKLTISTLRLDRANCVMEDDPVACRAEINAEIQEANAQRVELYREYIIARRLAGADLLKYNRLDQAIQSKDMEKERVYERIDKYQAKLQELRGLLMGFYKQYSEMLAGSMNIVFDSGWDEAVKQLREANKNKSFSPIETRNSRVDMQLAPPAGQEGFAPQGRILLGYTVDGKTHDPANPQDTMGSFSGSHAAIADISLVGACYYEHPDYFDDNPDTPAGTPLFGLTTRYEYPTAFYTKAHGWFNKYQAYTFIKKREESGALWWKEVKESTTTETELDEVMEIHIESEEELTAAQKSEMRLQIQMELLQGAMLEFGEPNYTSTTSPQLPHVTSGVEVIANGVMNTCGWYNIYCAGVSWVLRGLDAIFPGPDSETSFKKTYDAKSKFTYSTETKHYLPATTTFTDLNL